MNNLFWEFFSDSHVLTLSGLQSSNSCSCHPSWGACAWTWSRHSQSFCSPPGIRSWYMNLNFFGGDHTLSEMKRLCPPGMFFMMCLSIFSFSSTATPLSIRIGGWAASKLDLGGMTMLRNGLIINQTNKNDKLIRNVWNVCIFLLPIKFNQCVDIHSLSMKIPVKWVWIHTVSIWVIQGRPPHENFLSWRHRRMVLNDFRKRPEVSGRPLHVNCGDLQWDGLQLCDEERR